MSAPLLEVENLRVTYRVGRRKVEAVKGVSFSVAPGSVVVATGSRASRGAALRGESVRLAARGRRHVHVRDLL